MGKDAIRLEKVADLMRLAHRLAGTSEGLTLDDISRDFSVSRRTAERMRDTLRDLFSGFKSVPDGAHQRFLIRGGLSPFLTAPSAVELAELDGQVRALEQVGHIERAQTLHRLADKVKAALRDKSKARTATDLEALRRAEAVARQVGPRAVCDPGTLDLLREALLTLKKVRFGYPLAGQASPMLRIVVPYGLLFGRNAYLVGHQGSHGEPVLWRLDRITDLEMVDEAASAPADFDLDAYAARSFGTFQEKPAHVVLRFFPDVAAEARRTMFHPSQQMQDLDDGRVEVRFTAGGLLEMVHHLFTWGEGVEIVAPEALRSLMVHELERALGRHRTGNTNGYSN